MELVEVAPSNFHIANILEIVETVQIVHPGYYAKRLAQLRFISTLPSGDSAHTCTDAA
jgi:hypothetical protein